MRLEKPTCSAETARSILERHTANYGLFLDLDRILEYQAWFIREVQLNMSTWQKASGTSDAKPRSSQDLYTIFTRRFGVDADVFMEHNKMAVRKKQIQSIIDGDFSDDVKSYASLTLYLRGCEQKVSSLRQYTELPLSMMESFDGHRMVLARPTWNILTTSRISARAPSLQNINRRFGDVITYPKGKVLLTVDSCQIEPRIIYSVFVRDDEIVNFINMYGDAYLGIYHYLFYRDKTDKVTITKDERNKLKTVTNAANYDSLLKGADPMIQHAYVEQIVNHRARLKWKAAVEEQVKRGITTFYSVFGTPITPKGNTKYTPGTPAWDKHLIRCGINNPVQTTASDLMNQAVYEADKIIRLRAVAQSWLGCSSHDAGTFYLDEADAHLANEIADCYAYEIPNWLPIPSEAHIGKKSGIAPEDMRLIIDEEDDDDGNESLY